MSDVAREMAELFSALIDESITDAEFSRLNELIATDALARAAFVRLMHCHAEMPNILANLATAVESEHALDDEMPTACAVPPARRSFPSLLQDTIQLASRPSTISLMTAAIVVGMLVVVMAFIGAPFYQKQPHAPGTNQPMVVATLSRMHQAKWSDSSQPLPVGSELAAGDRLELSEGVIELTFVDGAQVVLEGPVTFVASDANAGFVEAGRCTSLVPAKAVGFAIRTPCAQLVDLGTEFGVAVDETGTTDVHVFTGRVEAARITSAGVSKQRRTLVAGDSLRISHDSDSMESLSEGEEFVGTDDLSNLIDSESESQWREFAAAAAKDPRVIGYYAFEQTQVAKTLANSAMTTEGTANGQIEGATWVSGRWGDKDALRFHNPQDRVSLDFGSRPLTQLTLSAWVNLERLAQSHNAILHTDVWERDNSVHWTVLQNGSMEFAAYGCTPPVVKSDPAGLQQRLGQWVHLAVVFDGEAKSTRFYVNGNHHSTSRYETVSEIDLRRVQLGNWAGEPRPMIGRMDEFIVFQSALSDGEVRRIFSAGAP